MSRRYDIRVNQYFYKDFDRYLKREFLKHTNPKGVTVSPTVLHKVEDSALTTSQVELLLSWGHPQLMSMIVANKYLPIPLKNKAAIKLLRGFDGMSINSVNTLIGSKEVATKYRLCALQSCIRKGLRLYGNTSRMKLFMENVDSNEFEINEKTIKHFAVAVCYLSVTLPKLLHINKLVFEALKTLATYLSYKVDLDTEDFCLFVWETLHKIVEKLHDESKALRLISFLLTLPYGELTSMRHLRQQATQVLLLLTSKTKFPLTFLHLILKRISQTSEFRGDISDNLCLLMKVLKVRINRGEVE